MVSPVLIIVGMHRSGTSLTASLLQSAGLDIGSDLVGPHESNPKGHFENVDFLELHRKFLRSQGIHEDGWTLQQNIEVEPLYVREAKKLVAKNDPGFPWGWKEPRTTLFLEFWGNLLPYANFLMVYRSPWDVMDSLYRRGTDISLQRQPDLAAKIWLYYNQRILNFYNQFPERCLLVNIDTIVNHCQQWLKGINEKFKLNLAFPSTEIYDESLMETQEIDAYRPSLVNHYFPQGVELYKELETKAWWPNNAEPDLAWEEQITSAPYRLWVFEDWGKIRYLEKQNQDLQAQLAQCKMQLSQKATTQ